MVIKQDRKQCVAGLQRSIAIIGSAIAITLLTHRLPVLAAEKQPDNSRRTFADWCRDRASLNPETKHTVEVLLKIAETTECDEGDRKLFNLIELNLNNNQIDR